MTDQEELLNKAVETLNKYLPGILRTIAENMQVVHQKMEEACKAIVKACKDPAFVEEVKAKMKEMEVIYDESLGRD